jgi:hypothetical protein
VLGVEVPAHDPARVDADDVPAGADCWRLFNRDALGSAAHLQEAHVRLPVPGMVIDHEGDVGVDSNVPVLGRGLHGGAGDVDGAELGVVLVRDGLVVRRAVAPDRGEVPETMSREIPRVRVVKAHQITHTTLPRT